MESEQTTFLFWEWRIENFSCWRSDLHGRGIQYHSYGEHVLYPKGPSGLEERMEVHLSQIILRQITLDVDSRGELLFIGPDGSLISKQQVGAKILNSRYNGPRFEEVVRQIRKMEAEYGDRLTIQLRLNAKGEERHMCTLIEVIDTTVRIDTAKLKSGKNIFFISYSSHDKLKMDTAELNSGKSCISNSDDKLLFLNLSSVSADENKQLEFSLQSLTHRPISVQTRMSLINGDGSLARCEEKEHLFEDYKQWKCSDSLTKRELIEKGTPYLLLRIKITTGYTTTNHHEMHFCSEAVGAVPNDIVCTEKEPSADPFTSNKVSVAVLSKDLMCLYQDQDFSDLTLKCDDVTFPVHRAILSARSPVFKTMLSTDMKEAASGSVVVGDLDPSTLGLFLTYLYTGEVEDLESGKALKLYYAADKYQVPFLKRECTEFLCSNVSISNVCDILTLANRHNDFQLTAVSRNFILTNCNDLLRSKEWEIFMESEPLLAVKTLTQFSERNALSFTPLP